MPDDPNRYIPSEHALDVDRALDAKKITSNINKWKQNTNKMDLRGFDTTRQKLPSTRTVLNREGIGYIEREADRFVRDGQVAKDLLEAKSSQIYDYRTFVETLREAWNADVSLRSLVDNSNEKDFRALFETSRVQGWLRGNVRDVGIAGIMERLDISMTRATQLWGRLPDREKDRVIESVLSGKRFSITRATRQVRQAGTIRRARRRMVQQVGATGTSYRRTKPVQFTEMEIRFLTNRKRQDPSIPLRRLQEEHNAIFRRTPRTVSSLRNKVYRLGLSQRRNT